MNEIQPQDVTIDDVARVMQQYPDLTHHGIRRQRYPGWSDAEFVRQRDLLISDPSIVADVQRALYFLGHCKPATRKDPVPSSYGLKHEAEPIIGYTTNGAFIVAAVLAGVEMLFSDGPNPMLLVQAPDSPPPPFDPDSMRSWSKYRPDSYRPGSYSQRVHTAKVRKP